MTRTFSRRSMLTTTATALPTLAIGNVLFGGSSVALGAAVKKKKKKGVSNDPPAGPEGESTLITDLELPTELRGLAEEMLRKLRAAFTTAAANPDKKFAKNDLAGASARFIGGLTGKRIDRAKGRATKLVGGATSVELFGAHSTKASDWSIAVGIDTHMKAKLKSIDANGWRRVKDRVSGGQWKRIGPQYKKLEIHLNKVRCVVDTDEFDSDEILFGGEMVRPDGVVKHIDSFKVSDDFDRDETVHYDSATCIDAPAGARNLFEASEICHGHYDDPYRGKTLVRTNLDGPFPGTYSLVLMMVEEDYGGFNAFLTELYAATKDQIHQGVQEAARQGGQAITDGELGEVIGQVIAWVATEFVDWLAGLFNNQDDPISTKTWAFTLKSASQEWFNERTQGGLSTPNGQRASKMKKIDFAGDGGRFRANLHFRAIA